MVTGDDDDDNEDGAMTTRMVTAQRNGDNEVDGNGATGNDDGYVSYYNMGGVLKYLRFSEIVFHGQKRKKIYSPTHPFLMIKNCIHMTHKMYPPLALF